MHKLMVAIGLVVLAAPAVGAQDLAKLKGEWRGGDKKKLAMTWKFDERDVEISVEAPGEKGLTQSEFKLKEVDKKKAIVLDAKAVSGLELPGMVYYQLEGETLTITVPAGERKGEYKLERVKKK